MPVLSSRTRIRPRLSVLFTCHGTFAGDVAERLKNGYAGQEAWGGQPLNPSIHLMPPARSGSRQHCSPRGRSKVPLEDAWAARKRVVERAAADDGLVQIFQHGGRPLPHVTGHLPDTERRNVAGMGVDRTRHRFGEPPAGAFVPPCGVGDQ